MLQDYGFLTNAFILLDCFSFVNFFLLQYKQLTLIILPNSVEQEPVMGSSLHVS